MLRPRYDLAICQPSQTGNGSIDFAGGLFYSRQICRILKCGDTNQHVDGNGCSIGRLQPHRSTAHFGEVQSSRTIMGSICTQTLEMFLVSLSLDGTHITEAAACNLQTISASREIAGIKFCRSQVFIDFKARICEHFTHALRRAR